MASECVSLLRKLGGIAKQKGLNQDGGNAGDVVTMKEELEKMKQSLEGKEALS
jgi:hypothetical protein